MFTSIRKRQFNNASSKADVSRILRRLPHWRRMPEAVLAPIIADAPDVNDIKRFIEVADLHGLTDPHFVRVASDMPDTARVEFSIALTSTANEMLRSAGSPDDAHWDERMALIDMSYLSAVTAWPLYLPAYLSITTFYSFVDMDAEAQRWRDRAEEAAIKLREGNALGDPKCELLPSTMVEEVMAMIRSGEKGEGC